jgi:ribonucleoside-diphosphate reductase alpha chain
MYHPLFDKWRLDHPDEEKPGYFESANDLTPEEHVKVQAVAQKYIDSSISKTVNAPNSHTMEDVKRLYMDAYDSGLKGITYMRDGSRMGVLERIPEKKEEVAPVVPVTPRTSRPLVLLGSTYKTESPIGNVYVTINHDEEGHAFEVFVNGGKAGSDVMAMAEALGRMISFVLRIHSPVPARERLREVVSELTGIGGARSVGFGENRVRSLPDAVAKVLARHAHFRVNGKVEDRPTEPIAADAPISQELEPVGSEISTNGNGHASTVQASFLLKVDEPAASLVSQLNLNAQAEMSVEESARSGNTTNLFDICPECQSASFAYEEGCKKCYGCGYSEC